MTKISDYQLRQMVCSLSGQNIEEYDRIEGASNFIDQLRTEGTLWLPSNLHIYLVPERTAIFAAITKPKSWLMQLLEDRPEDVALVADSIKTGADAIYFVSLIESRQETDFVTAWRPVDCLAYMNPRHVDLSVRPLSRGRHVLVAAVSSFIRSSDVYEN